MSLAPYREVLSHRAVRDVLLLSMLARLPIVSAPVVMTLHVVLELHRGFAQSGLVASTFAIGGAVGGPLVGRGIDRIGLRPVVACTTAVSGVFWFAAVWLPYPVLGAAAFIGGGFVIPIFALPRQTMSAILPEYRRQPGFSLDSMGTEISYSVGPALGILAMTQLGSQVTVPGIAVLIVISGAAIWALNPPVHPPIDLDLASALDAPAASGPDGAGAGPRKASAASGTDGAGAGARKTAAASGPDGAGSGPRKTAATSEPDGAEVGAGAHRPSIRTWWSAPVGAVLLVSGISAVILLGTDVVITATMRHMGQVPLIGVVFAVWCMASLVGGLIYGASRPIHAMTLLAAMGALCLPIVFATNWWTLALLLIPTGMFCAPLIATTGQVLTQLTPPGVRGQVMGLHGSAFILGNALGAPVIGALVDHIEPRRGFVVLGLLGIAISVALLPLRRRIPVGASAPDTPAALAPDPPDATTPDTPDLATSSTRETASLEAPAMANHATPEAADAPRVSA
ncbi:MAG: MFS transporter [Frankiaceae bacterium]|nr:MFS transporter [Frankiaceae bacterium]